MPSRHLSLRLEDDTFEQLDNQSRQTGQTRSNLARTLLEEGLRMGAHPGIVFRPGPVGRRPGLASGPDVWEVAQVIRDLEVQGEDPVRKTAELRTSATTVAISPGRSSPIPGGFRRFS